MRDEILLSRDYFDEVVDKIINEILEKNDLPIEIVLVKAMSMAEFACDMSNRLFGKMEDK